MTQKRESPAPLRTGTGLSNSAGTAHRQCTATPSPITSHARLAPYARAVLGRVRSDRSLNVFLFAGSDAWNKAEQRRRQHGEGSALVLPLENDPQDFRWPRLDSLVVIPGDCDGERFRALVVALLTAGCRCVIEARSDQAPAAHYSDEKDALEAA